MTDVLVTGAGMSGIACARALQTAGVSVRLIDKGRGIGGRVATRRADVAGESITFDHGTQYLDQSEDAESIAKLGRGAVDVWQIGDRTHRVVGVPGMAALPKALAHGLDVALNTRVTTVVERGAHWQIETDAGKMTASHVVVTVPAPQLAPILGETHTIVQQSASAVMRPCLTLMAAFDRDTPAPFVTRRDANAVLTWIAQNNTKPGRSNAYSTWVAQAHPDWSEAHIDADRSEIKMRMVDLLCSALSVAPSKLRHAGLQGWRYGLVETHLGKPFLSEGTLWAGGDWCCGPKIQDAWRSGLAIAASILHSFRTSAYPRSATAN
ncbi:MAG: FAD-dependent oxidoreductase [Pseudomonadota bacterium]